MKKALLILALVVAYGVSISNASPKVISAEKSKVTVVADNDNFSVTVEEKKDKKKEKKETTAKKASSDKATVEAEAPGCSGAAGCSAAQKKDCATAGKTCSDAKAATKTKSCCGDKKK